MSYAFIRTDDLPPSDRFAYWYELATQAHMPAHVRSDGRADFRATMGVLGLGAIQLSKMTFPSLAVQRTTKQVRQSDPEVYHLCLIQRGRCQLTHRRRDATLDTNHFAMYDSSRPYDIRSDNSTPDVRALIVQIPKALLPLRPQEVDGLLATPLSRGNGVAAVLSRYLVELAKHADHYGPLDTSRMATATIDLLAVMCSEHLDKAALTPSDSRHRILQARINAFISHRLDDPELSPETIAAAHYISVRQLHRLFREQGRTVAAWIRYSRLERCRRDLADPQQLWRPIRAIAARWCFLDNTQFSRAFRGQYGMTPRDYRHSANHARTDQQS